MLEGNTLDETWQGALSARAVSRRHSFGRCAREPSDVVGRLAAVLVRALPDVSQGLFEPHRRRDRIVRDRTLGSAVLAS